MSYRVIATWAAPVEPGIYTSRWADNEPPDATYAEVLATCARREDADDVARRARASRPNAQIEVSDTDEHHRYAHQRTEAADLAMADAIAAYRSDNRATRYPLGPSTPPPS